MINLVILLTSCCLLQMAIWPTIENWFMGIGCLFGGLITVVFYANKQLWRKYPVSSLSICGYSAYYFYLPPMITLIEFNPLTTNLSNPIFVTLTSLLFLSTLITSHIIYIKTSLLQFPLRECKKLLGKASLYYQPSIAVAFMIGFLGLVPALANLFIGGHDLEESERGTVSKSLSALTPLMYIPFVLLLNTFSVSKSNATKMLMFTGCYSTLIFGYGLMHNTRTPLLIGITSVTMCALWFVVIGKISISRRLQKHLLVLTSLAAIALCQFADLAVAMVMVRDQRYDLPPAEMIGLTFSTFMDKQSIQQYKQDSHERRDGSLSDEYYVGNVFFSRLCNLRFLDIGLSHVKYFSSYQATEILTLEYQLVMATFPRPLLTKLDPTVNKDLVASASSGDLMLYVGTGETRYLGGFRTGSLIASAIACFGILFPLFVIPIAAATFAVTDTLCQSTSANAILSPLCVVFAFDLCFHWTSAATGCEGVSDTICFLIRGFPQTAVVYLLAVNFARLAENALRFSQPAKHRCLAVIRS